MGRQLAKRLFYAALLSTLFSCSLTQTAERERRQADIYMTAGVEALTEGRSTDALIAFTEVVKRDPRSVQAWNNLGLAYYAKEQNEKAEESWKKAISLDKNFSEAHNNLGAMYLHQKKFKLAEPHFKEVLRNLLYNKVAQTHFNLSLLYAETAKPLLAEQHLKLTVQNDPNFCVAWFRLGSLQKSRGEFSAAEQSIKKSIAGTCFNNPEAHYEMGNLYLKARETDRAKSKFLEIIELFPASQWARKAEITLNMLR